MLHRDPSVFLQESRSNARAFAMAWFGQRRLVRRFTRQQLATALFHGPNYFLPDSVDTGLITVHDLSVMKHPETHPAERIRHFEREFARSLERSAFVITDTEFVRQELIAELGVPAERVRAIHLGADSRYRPRSVDELANTLTAMGLAPGRYGLCVSTLEPRKRIADLLRAWSCLPADLRLHCPLLLVGQRGWLNDDLLPLLDRAISEGWVRWLGYVPEHQLPLLYAGAGVFVYPSIYEGFGLPALEAMSCGVPVIVAEGTCLAEVCGTAAVYVAPADHTGFADMIEQCLADQNRRSSMSRAGLERAAAFSWNKCADETTALYHEAWHALR